MLRGIALLGERERAHLVVQLARFFCVVRVSRYRIVSKCFYALLFRRPRGEKYRNNCVWKLYQRLRTLGPSSARVDRHHAPQPTKSTRAYTSAASCSVCCTKAGSIQRTSYKRGESSKLYRKGRLIYRKERFEPRHTLATLQRRGRISERSQPAHLLQCLRLFIVVLQELQCLPNCLHVCMIRVRGCYHIIKFCYSIPYGF